MGDVRGFLEIKRGLRANRDVQERLKDYSPVYAHSSADALPCMQKQASRCMDCGVPFCHHACPLHNVIPDWNHLLHTNRSMDAYHRLRKTNNFPEFTGRICPAPCEDACVLEINDKPVTIQKIEQTLADIAYDNNWLKPDIPSHRTGKSVSIVGSGPSGLSCADQLNKAGHTVTVYERSDRIGGLLCYGIPDFKLSKDVLDHRINIMKEEGIVFITNTFVGKNIPLRSLKERFDAVVLAIGATRPRDLEIPNRNVEGIHFAMKYLSLQNKINRQDQGIVIDPSLNAKGKSVIILGGGDTGSDCHGTALRQGAKSVLSLELFPKPAKFRQANNPWPDWRKIYRVSSSHEEGGERDWGILTEKFEVKNGKVIGIRCVKVRFIKDSNGQLKIVKIPDSTFYKEADLVLLALGFLGPETILSDELELSLTDKFNFKADVSYMTHTSGIFVCGDMRRGQSLVVWAIAEGRTVATHVSQFLGY